MTNEMYVEYIRNDLLGKFHYCAWLCLVMSLDRFDNVILWPKNLMQ